MCFSYLLDSARREQQRVSDDNEQAMLAGNDEDYDEFMRLPVAQRQLFMRIRNNQRQQGFAKDGPDDPVITGKAGGLVLLNTRLRWLRFWEFLGRKIGTCCSIK